MTIPVFYQKTPSYKRRRYGQEKMRQKRRKINDNKKMV